MAYQATWNDPIIHWDDLYYSWDGNHVDPESPEARLRQSSVFVRLVSQSPFVLITQQRLHALVTDGN